MLRGTNKSNWRYCTEADVTGPRKHELLLTMSDAKTSFKLNHSDLKLILGYRSTNPQQQMTKWYFNDLVAASIAKHGQHFFDNNVPEGKELSGVAARERAAREEVARLAAEATADRSKYTVVPLERLSNCGLSKLQAILVRCEGGKILPRCVTKEQCLARIQVYM